MNVVTTLRLLLLLLSTPLCGFPPELDPPLPLLLPLPTKMTTSFAREREYDDNLAVAEAKSQAQNAALQAVVWQKTKGKYE